MNDRICLRGIDVYAHHGVHPAERELGQRFVIDAELAFDCSAAARSDRLEKALDYTLVHALVARTTAETRFQLIEALAGRPVHCPAAGASRGPGDPDRAQAQPTYSGFPGSGLGHPGAPAGLVE